MSNLSALRQRIEAAGGPDREIDRLIARRFFLVTTWHGEWWIVDDDGPAPGRWHRRAPEFTASVDLALALVERVLPGSQWSKSPPDGGPHVISLWKIGPRTARKISSGCAETIPAAILSALLAALEAK